MTEFNKFSKKSVCFKIYKEFPKVSNLEIIKMDKDFFHPDDDDYFVSPYLYVFEVNLDNIPIYFEIESSYFIERIKPLFSDFKSFFNDLYFEDIDVNEKCYLPFVKNQIRLQYNHKAHKSSAYLNHEDLELISSIILKKCKTLGECALFIKEGFTENGCLAGLLNDKPELNISFEIS